MPTFHRRNGSVKYVPPKRLLEGLRPAVAIPAVLFASLVVIGIAFALYKTPKEQKWLNLRPELAWRPAVSEQGEALSADERFLFTSPLDRARIPRATRRGTDSEETGKAATPAAGFVVMAGNGQILIEHAIGEGIKRRFARTRIDEIDRLDIGTGMLVQRGERVAEGDSINIETAAEIQGLPDASAVPPPEILESAAEQAIRFGS